MNARHLLLSRSRFCVLVICTGLALLGACKKQQPAPPPAGPLPVNVVTAIEKEITEWVELSGRTGAVETVEIQPRVTGYLTEVNFKAGDIVKKGDPLFVIDPRPYQADYERAVANLAETQAKQKLAAVDFERAETLRKKGVLAAEEFDQKAAALQQSEASVSAAQAAKDTAELNLQFTKIVSPIDGRVSDARVTVGNLVQAGGAGSTTALTSVVSIDPIYVYVDADENVVLNFMKQSEAGQRQSARVAKIPAYIQLGNETGFPHEGYLDFVDNRLDPATGTLRARGVFKTWDPLLTPGFFVRMRIPAGPPVKAILIPDEVISSQQGVKYVFVVKPDDTIERRNLETGTLSDGMRVVRSGLKAGEQVVSTRLQMLQPGMIVKPIPSEKKPAPEAKQPAAEEKQSASEKEEPVSEEKEPAPAQKAEAKKAK